VLVLFVSGPGVGIIGYQIAFNLLLFTGAGAMIYYSVRMNSVKLANISIAGLVLILLTRYFDVFFDRLSGSALFLVTGILLLGGGFILERNRRKLVAMIRSESEEEAS